jgi:riboflavin transporter FmnP
LKVAKWIAGTSVLSALTIVFDLSFWALKIKIPFPLFPTLKFDLDGIPIVLAWLIYGSYSALITSIIAFLTISFRSGAFISAFMKALAEFATATGLLIIQKTYKPSKPKKIAATFLGITIRCIVMTVANLIVFPAFYKKPFEATLALLPFITIFNIIAGLISLGGGFLIYNALLKRLPETNFK